MKITKANLQQADQIAFIISESNKDVAKKFNLTRENNPKHPSFYNKEWVLSDFDRGEEYFLAEDGGISVGCVAFEQPEKDIAYLNRLSVLPEYRHKGTGALLVQHILDHSRSKHIKVVSIGIIAAHKVLKSWYVNLGFIEGETTIFDHLPFDVTYMRFKL